MRESVFCQVYKVLRRKRCGSGVGEKFGTTMCIKITAHWQLYERVKNIVDNLTWRNKDLFKNVEFDFFIPLYFEKMF